MREEFWKEVNEARELNQSKLWKGVFPEASVLDMNCLCDINQYLVSVNGQNVFDGGGPMISPVHGDPRVKPFYTEFINNLKRVGTEIDWNSLFFFSLCDTHNSFPMHGDTETVFLIQGYGDVGMITVNDDGSKKVIHHMETGDVLLIPPLYNHKPVPLGPRVTLSLGALPKAHRS